MLSRDNVSCCSFTRVYRYQRFSDRGVRLCKVARFTSTSMCIIVIQALRLCDFNWHCQGEELDIIGTNVLMLRKLKSRKFNANSIHYFCIKYVLINRAVFSVFWICTVGNLRLRMKDGREFHVHGQYRA